MAADNAVAGLPDGVGPDCVRFRATRRQLLPALIVPVPVLAEQAIFSLPGPGLLPGVLDFSAVTIELLVLLIAGLVTVLAPS